MGTGPSSCLESRTHKGPSSYPVSAHRMMVPNEVGKRRPGETGLCHPRARASASSIAPGVSTQCPLVATSLHLGPILSHTECKGERSLRRPGRAQVPQ